MLIICTLIAKRKAEPVHPIAPYRLVILCFLRLIGQFFLSQTGKLSGNVWRSGSCMVLYRIQFWFPCSVSARNQKFSLACSFRHFKSQNSSGILWILISSSSLYSSASLLSLAANITGAIMGNVKELKAMIASANENQAPSSVKDLVLDEAQAEDLSEITELLAAHTALQSLSLDSVGLTSLKGLPSLPNLKKLSVGNNKIAEGLELLAKQCPKLETLNLANNQTIKSMEELSSLKQLTHLTSLDLEGCELTKNDQNLEKLRELLPQVKTLNKKENEGDNDEDDEDGDDDDDDDDEEESEDDEEGVSKLKKLLGDINEDEDDDDDFQEEEDEDESDEDDDIDDEEETPQKGSDSKGVKRKRDNEEEDDDE